MLSEGERLITPQQIKDQIPWDKAVTVVVLVQMPNGKENELFMSSASWNEVSFLSKQLDAHITHHIGAMKEGS